VTVELTFLSLHTREYCFSVCTCISVFVLRPFCALRRKLPERPMRTAEIAYNILAACPSCLQCVHSVFFLLLWLHAVLVVRISEHDRLEMHLIAALCMWYKYMHRTRIP
jgi:hypothetical protein